MSISSIVYGINDVSDISSSTPQFTADKARVGWNYQASGATDNISLKIFSEDGLTNTNNLFNVTVRGAVGNTTYANIPYLVIKTKPKGDGTDFDPSYHSEQIFKIDDNNFVSPDELVYFYYNNLVPQLDEFKKAEYKLVTTNGTLDPTNPILTVELKSDNSSTTSFYLQNTEVISKNHQHKFNRIIEYRNKDRLESDLVADIDSINTNTASILANQTNGTQEVKCMGVDSTATQQQVRTTTNGSVVVAGTVDALMKGFFGGSSTNIQVNSGGILLVEENTTYEDETIGNADNLKVYANSTDAIDMDTFTHLVISVSCAGMTGSLGKLQNIKMYYSIDNSTYILGEVIDLNEVPNVAGTYTGFIRLERTGFRYVKLFAVGISGILPTSTYTIKYSRS
tara:strand:+ start:245 stop:1432 length:1188 start_codon:yes stop_codon:yes gene_type:complete